MAKLFGNLHLVLAIGLALAIAVMIAFAPTAPVDANAVLRWLHVFFGIVWIGLLYYLNFVQVPTMPSIPAEQKPAIIGHIAPKVFFFFRYAALLTVITGLGVAGHGHGDQPGYLGRALTFSGAGNENLIGLGMWIALVMAFNVWFLIWPNQQKVLGLVEASAEERAAAGRVALYASRFNTMMSITMLYCMVGQSHGGF